VGIPTVRLMTGDRLKLGDGSGAAPVCDVGSGQLLSAARTLREQGRPICGRAPTGRPAWPIGAMANPFAPPAGFRGGPARRDPAIPVPTLGGQRAH
jgi:methylenetetrahydrofolate reductase (NADPH)